MHGLILLLLGLVLGGGLLFRRSQQQAPPPRVPSPVLIDAAEPPTVQRPVSSEDAPDSSPSPAGAQESPVQTSEETPKRDLAGKVGIRGVLLDENGQGLPFVKVEAFDVDMRRKFVRLQAETGPKGEFKIDCPSFSRATFTAHVPGHGRALWSKAISHAQDPLLTSDIVLKLFPQAVATGTLEYADGSPVPQAKLKFHPLRMGSSNSESPANFNVINGQHPADEAWDEICRRELFLTDCEVTTGARGDFQAGSLLEGIHYIVEVLQEGRDPVTIPMSTTRLRKGPVCLRISR